MNLFTDIFKKELSEEANQLIDDFIKELDAIQVAETAITQSS